MTELNINCDFHQSQLNNDLYICKNCGTVIHKSNLKFSAICPVLLDRAAMDPNYPQVKLEKIEAINSSTNVTTNIPVPPRRANIDNDWWNATVNVQKVEPALQAAMPNFENPNTGHKQQCTQEQIDQRMSICQGCEFFQNNTCLQCGCALSRDKVYMNKLVWADQSCPIGKWGPVTSS